MRRWGWLLLAACAGTAEEPAPKGPLSGCDPLDPALCALPFPSDHFLVDDPTTPSGHRVNFGPDSLPENRDGVQTAPDAWNRRDGFSINSALMTHLPGLSVEGHLSHTDLGAYLGADVKSVIVDAQTGDRHPHWLELDVTSPEPTSEDDKRLALLRPAKPFEWTRRYVVGLRDLRTTDGAVIEASPAFAALRDGTPSDDPDVEKRRQHFEDVIFPALQAQGFARDELVLAWDFTTASRANTVGNLEFMRDDALAWAATNGFTYTLEEVEERDCDAPGEHIARHIEGSFVAPYYTTADGPNTKLARDAQGRPAIQGTKDVDFIVRVPCSVAGGAQGQGAAPASAGLVQYGHGLLGSHGEVNGGYLAELADRYGWLLFAQGWTGFKGADAPAIALMIALDPSDFDIVPEGSHQGMVEFVLGLRFVTEVLKDDDALRFDGHVVLDPARRWYYGNSQGGIMGSAYLALSQDIDRGVLGVGGGPYSLLLNRSSDFDDFFRLFKEKYLDHRDITLFVNGLTQQLWDPVEPGGWVWDMTRDVARPKQVLMQVGIGDRQVTTLGAHYQARAYDAKLLAPQTRPVWGLDEVSGPVTGPVLVEYLYQHTDPEPVLGLPANEPDTHECPRRERAAQDQMQHFFETGEIIQTCDDACVREACP